MQNLEEKTGDMNLNDHTAIIVCAPDHLIDEHILPRLPVRSLLRFKSVSRIWKDTISSTEFAKTRFKLASSCHQFLFFAYGDRIHPSKYISTCFLLSYDKGKYVMDVLSKKKYKFEDNHVFKIVGSCHGLICFDIWLFGRSFSVWNPVTNEYRNIDDPEGADMVRSNAFGYVSSLDDYKIVASFKSKYDQDLCCFYMFSLRAWKWQRIGCLDHREEAYELHNIVLVDDTLYCIREVKEVGLWRTKIFAGYNLVTEELKEFPRLNWLARYSKIRYNVVRGCLTLLCDKNQVMDAWTLKQSGDWSSWGKLFSLNLKDVQFHCISEAGKCLVKVFKNGASQLKVIDPNQEAPEISEEGIDFENLVFMSAGFNESLISLSADDNSLKLSKGDGVKKNGAGSSKQ